MDINEFHGLTRKHRQGYTGKGVKIAVIDTGAWEGHDALRDRVVARRNFVQPDYNDTSDTHGHGTRVAGTVANVAPEAELLIAKVSTGAFSLAYHTAQAVDWAVAQGADVINISRGSKYDSHAQYLAIRRALDAGVLVVCAVGNDGDGDATTDEVRYPASYDDVVAVGAVDKDRRPARFSNSDVSVDCVALGVNVRVPNNDPRWPSGTTIEDGTSYATPIVAGIGAILVQQYGRDRLCDRLLAHCEPIDADRRLVGEGVVTLRRDVELAPAVKQPADKAASWAQSSWVRGYNEGWIDGTRPSDYISRQELVVILDRLIPRE
ncbi:S8 family serine peptidase [Bacillaceae bacterium SIJ1]|uniref:S8 family serine peptidase n=1 Tax=Litoribacterium kuwaitense TaxID=1398745 RepID=UPI0013EAD01C|nr:S8 family serine peptidase [Litoribacterium kuwaitense]NGP46919.1 S8 family serine peptidase [Litoribacterium kuwaitense]